VVFAILVVFALIRFAPAARTTTGSSILPTTAQGTAATQPHGTPAAGLHVYTNTALGVRFDLPNSWSTEDQSTSYGPGVQATSPDGTAAIGVESVPSGNGNEVAAANGALSGVADSGIVDNKEGPSYVTFGGTTWVQESGDLTRSGTRLHMVVLVAIHGSRAYLLFFIATLANFASDDAHFFHATTQSFQFLS
jgi:hypothetical protein